MTGAVEDKVKIVLTNILCVPYKDIQLTSKITEDLGADSLDSVEIMINLEQEFEIEINDDDVRKIRTVEELVKYMEGRIK